MSKLENLRNELIELNDFIDKRINEINTKYCPDIPNSIIVNIMPNPLSNKVYFAVDLTNSSLQE